MLVTPTIERVITFMSMISSCSFELSVNTFYNLVIFVFHELIFIEGAHFLFEGSPTIIPKETYGSV